MTEVPAGLRPVSVECTGVEWTGAALVEAAQEILERMFFLSMEVAEQLRQAEPRGDVLAVEIRFHGERAGRLRLVVAELCARELAANFIGFLDPGQLRAGPVTEVLRELTNMVCGATLSRLAPQAVFDLDPPVLVSANKALANGAEADGAQVNEDSPELVRRLTSGSGRSGEWSAPSSEEWIDLYWRWDEAGGERTP